MKDNLPLNTISAKYHDIYWLPVANRTDLFNSIDEDERFMNGDHYIGDNAGNYIRVMANHIADGISKRASKINGTPLHLAFTASDNKTDCTLLSRHDNYVLASMGHEAFSLQSATNGENLGTEITYMGYDADAPHMYGSRFAGGLFENHISPKNFAVANIHQPDVQKQAWVMSWYDVAVKELIALLKEEKFTDEEYEVRLHRLYKEAQARSKQPDDQNPSKELMAETLVRTYYREFRVNGEVCYTLETNTVPLFKYPKPKSKILRKDFAKKVWEEFEKRKQDKDANELEFDERSFSMVDDMDIDFEDSIVSIEKEANEQDERNEREKFSLYSFAVFTPKKINNFFFGRSLTKEMIPMQKAINYSLSMMLKALENISYGKVIAREGAMKNGETWDNGPESNVVHDHYKGNGNGFYQMNPSSMPADLFKLAEYYVSEMKDANGFNDFANGEMANPETSGYAVSLMLKQANSTLEQEQKLFWQYQVDLARIRLMYYKHYFKKSCFVYELTDTEFNDEEKARMDVLGRYAAIVGGQKGVEPLYQNGQAVPAEAVFKTYMKPTSRRVVKEFDPDTIWGVDFDIKIVAQQGLVESELSTQQWYTQMFGNGGIQAFKEDPDLLKFIIKTAPKGCLPEEMRATMEYWAEDAANSKIRQLEQQVAQLSAMLQQAATFGKEQENQFRQSMNVANTIATNATKDRENAQRQLSLLQQGREEGEIKSNNAKGLDANTQAQITPSMGQQL